MKSPMDAFVLLFFVEALALLGITLLLAATRSRWRD